jgi:hypothetical protein
MTMSQTTSFRNFVLAIALIAPLTTSAQTGQVPKPAVDLKPGVANYKVRFEVVGQSATMDITRTTKLQNGAWVVTETSVTPQYSGSDETTIEKKTLIIRKRVFHDKVTAGELRFVGHNATGEITANGQKQSINVDLGGVVFADGAGGQDVLAALPLAKGYTAEFRNFGLQQQNVKTLQLRVMGTDTVSVPAGTFNTWKVLIVSLDGGDESSALWVEKRTHRVVKYAMSFPGFHDAVATAELMK